MGIVSFEVYKIEYFQEGEGYYDNNGDYHTCEGTWMSLGRCNAVPSGRYNIISLPDGSKETFSFTIIIHDPRCREFHYGERLRLTTIFEKEQINLIVKGFARFQHQCKIYA